MGREKKQYTSYQAMPSRSRFWLYSEACYTDDELNLRTWVLNIRANSGIHPDYLTNSGSWFAEDEQALVNAYDNSWFFSRVYKTRQVLRMGDFLVKPVDSQRLQWPQLYELMQRTGDYLRLRNKDLRVEHLNQPMNFILLDINNILKGISQNPNIAQTKKELELLHHYIHTIEANTSPLIGSDRLFLANLRAAINNEVKPYLTHLAESQLLKDRLVELAKTTQQLYTECNRGAHFAFNPNAINPHPRDLLSGQPEDLKAYPTLAAKECAKKETQALATSISTLKLSSEGLRNCAHFSLINMEDEVLQLYAKAVVDLNELARFQKIIEETIGLLGQAGEVYTVYQFKEQLTLLLTQLDHFVEFSAQTMDDLLLENTQAYHKAIQDEQKLSFFQRWFTSEQEKLDTFIKNQDILSQYPSTASELAQTRQELKKNIAQILEHLNKSATPETNFVAIAEQAQELNRLMGSMHDWVSVQYEAKGLTPPQKPEQLRILPKVQTPPLVECVPSTVEEIISTSNTTANFSQERMITPNTASAICPPDRPECSRISVSQTSTQNSLYLIGLVTLIPIGLILLYLLLKSRETPEPIIYGSKEEFGEVLVKLEDLIAQIKGAHEYDEDRYDQLDFEDFISRYERLCRKAHSKCYEVENLKDLYDDMNAYYGEFLQQKMYLQ
ncbi:hypothetical protein [Legionella saoudiensis]|uniref:hypothetical protein n=1 Tax=Legionella saoudiensis TaxID=1750561 RepID=UPI0007302DB8|nr:hypothetical protein [Legionella saoudiensis]